MKNYYLYVKHPLECSVTEDGDYYFSYDFFSQGKVKHDIRDFSPSKMSGYSYESMGKVFAWIANVDGSLYINIDGKLLRAPDVLESMSVNTIAFGFSRFFISGSEAYSGIIFGWRDLLRYILPFLVSEDTTKYGVSKSLAFDVNMIAAECNDSASNKYWGYWKKWSPLPKLLLRRKD